MAIQADGAAPYAPSSTVLGIIDRARTRGLPAQLSSEALTRLGVSESLAPRTLQALELLELVDKDGNPTINLEDLRRAGEGDFKTVFADHLRAAYAEVFRVVDPGQDDAVRVRDAFRGFKPVGQQDRMVSLFMGLCEYVGIASKRTTERKQPATAKPKAPPARKAAPLPKTRAPVKVGNYEFSEGLPAPLQGLLHSLPPQGAGWTAERRAGFMTALGAVLDFCYPIREAEPGQEENDESEGTEAR